MSSDEESAGFAPPAFKPADALLALRRQLRECKPLVERGSRWELRGRAVIELTADEAAISARLARRPALSQEWESFRLATSLELRRFVDSVRKRLAQWEGDE